MVYTAHNNNLRARLHRLKNIFIEEGVSLREVEWRDLERIQFGSANRHYREPLNLVKVILRRYIYESFNKAEMKRGVNFLVDENWVFECFMTHMVEEVINEYFHGWEVKPQYRLSGLLKKCQTLRGPSIKPDIIIERNGERYAIDFKYKIEPNSADYYQVLAYSMAISKTNRERKCVLWCATPAGHDESKPVFTIDESLNPNFNLSFYIFGMNFQRYDKLEKKFISEVKNDIKKRLEAILTTT